MQQSEIAELFRPILAKSDSRRRMTDYVTFLIAVVILSIVGYGWWNNAQVPKIESLAIVPGSVVVLGPADRVTPAGQLEFCPGDTMTVRYELAIDGEGTIYADDAAHHQTHTVKFSHMWRDIVRPGVRTYEHEWIIPPRPVMAFEGRREWIAGDYLRVISIAASNLYISRYVEPATLEVQFTIREGCD